MNKRQSLKAATAKIEELEAKIAELKNFNMRSVAEVRGLNACIDSVIAGEKTYCDWCEEKNECQLEAKGKGCDLWWLMMDLEMPEREGDQADESKGILSASPVG